MGQVFRDLLVALVDVGLNHDTDDGVLTVGDLSCDLATYLRLVSVVLVRVAVRAVNHENLTGRELFLCFLDGLFVVVGASLTTTEDDKARVVTLGGYDGGKPVFGDTHEMVGVFCSLDGVDGDTEGTVGTIFETNWEGEAGGQLSVELGFGGSGTNGTEGETVVQVLRGGGVQHLRTDRQAEICQVDEELSGETQTFIYVERPVQVWVVDETLPADGGSWLFQVCSHDDDQLARKFFCQRLEQVGVVHGGLLVVQRAWPDNDQQTVVLLLDDGRGLLTSTDDRLQGVLGGWDLSDEELWGDEGVAGEDTEVVVFFLCRGSGV